MAAAGTTYALVRVPFGWHQAPGLVLHLIADVLCGLPDTQMVIVQYLDDILFVGRDRLVTTQVARDTAAHLARKGFIVSLKSILDATQSLPLMGKHLSLNRPPVAHKPEGLADIVGRWVTLSLAHYTPKPLQRLLGRIGWLARPGFAAFSRVHARGFVWVRLRLVLFRLPCVGASWRHSLQGAGEGQRSVCTPTLHLARLRQGVSLWGCGAQKALLSAGARSGSVASSPLTCLVYCVRLTLRAVVIAGMWIWLWTTWAR